MDDLGAEYISEMSSTTGIPPRTPTPKDDKPLLKEQQHSLDITPVLEDLSLDIDSDEGKEKTDATPENIKKIDDVITSPNANEVINRTPVTGVSPTCAADDDESSLISAQQKNAMAFTIDFGGNKNDNLMSEQQAAKYKNIMERFQNRHKRGASMSKLESSGESSQATVALPPQPTTAAKVKLRIRERSTSGVRDSNKRHSWSPRSSTHESSAPPVLPTPPPRVNKNPVNNQKSLPVKPTIRKKEAFTPKSLAMQKAMEKFELYLPEPPLISNGKNLAEGDGVSEAGEFVDLFINSVV